MSPHRIGRAEFSVCSDQRLPELLFRYRARNFPETLSDGRDGPMARNTVSCSGQEGSFHVGTI